MIVVGVGGIYNLKLFLNFKSMDIYYIKCLPLKVLIGEDEVEASEVEASDFKESVVVNFVNGLVDAVIGIVVVGRVFESL